jgi:hypothetical protein
MSKVKITGHASGSGTLTLTGPNTNSDRTITLPDSTGTLLASEGAVTINDSGADVDFRVESDTNANSIFVQGSNGAVGLGVSSIATNDALHIENGESYLVMKDAQQMGIKLYGDDTNVIYSYDKTADSLTGGVTWAHADGATNFYTGGLNARMTIDSTGAVTMPNQPAFSARVATQQNNLAINSDVTVLFDSEVFDQNADFNTSTNTFTAPVTGRYFLAMNLVLNVPDAAAGFYQFSIKTSNRNHTQTNTIAGSTDPTYWTFNYSVLTDMDAGDTSYINFYQNIGTAQTDVRAMESTFSGYLVA